MALQPMYLEFTRSPDHGWRADDRPHIFMDGGMWNVCHHNPRGSSRTWFPTFALAAHYARHVSRSVRG